MDAIFGESQNAAITGSVVIKESNNYYNRMLFVFLQAKYNITIRGICLQLGKEYIHKGNPKANY
jgi:hypothetical protein